MKEAQVKRSLKAPVRGASSRQPVRKKRFSFNRELFSKGVYSLGALAVVAGFAYAVVSLLHLPVSRVVVNGEFRQVEKQLIVKQVQPFLQSGFVMLDLAGIRERLKHIPWVFDAKVTRQWPSEIVISVEEQTVIARWGSRGFLNNRGELFQPRKTRAQWIDSDSLPLLDGPEGSSKEVMNTFRQLSDALGQYGLALTELTLNDRGSWSARLQGGTRILLGNSDVMGKMRHFLYAYRGVLEKDFARVKRVDMRYSRGFAVAWDKGGKPS